MLNNPLVMKLAMILVAAGLYIASVKFPDIKDALQMLAGAVVGGAVIKRPGDN